MEWTKEMKRYTFWDFKGQALDLELIPNLGGVLSDDSDADSELGLLREAHGKLPISEQDMLTDKRMYRSHAAQIAEMNHYLTRLNMESAEDLNNLIILPQILLSLRHADHWGPAPGAIKHKRPDFEGLILVSLHYLFLKHAQVRGTLDEVRLSFTEIEAALEDEFFWGQSQICEYFTVDDLAWMCRGEATFSWSQFPALLQDIRLLTRQRVELVDRMNTITDNIDDDIARHKSSDAMDGIEHLKEVADAMLDSMVHGEENLKPAVIQRWERLWTSADLRCLLGQSSVDDSPHCLRIMTLRTCGIRVDVGGGLQCRRRRTSSLWCRLRRTRCTGSTAMPNTTTISTRPCKCCSLHISSQR